MAFGDVLKELTERGYIHQQTPGLEAHFGKGMVTAYVGYDCTAPSLHAGSLVSIMMLRILQKHGHRPIVLMGGGTSRVGDPSGKDSARQLMTTETIDGNLRSIQRIFEKFLKFGDTGNGAVMVNNADWLVKLNYLDFLRDYGRHFSVNRMLKFDSVSERMKRDGDGLSFLEFNYMVLQAYDFVELARRLSCTLQMGGSDQWGNIVNGIELGRRTDDKELFALTCPLLMTASGAKMGKTADGAVWLNAEAKSPYDYWQYWRNTEDADVGRFLRLFTELPISEIAKLEALKGQELNEAKKVLATEVTALCHGREAAEHAAETAKKTFEQGGAGADLPVVQVPKAELEAGIAVFALLARAGLSESNSEARKLVRNNGAKLNDAAVTDEKRPVTLADLNADGAIKLSAGKKRHVLVRPA
ncbi:MAG: tyrosine--tRNA ligase [Myxococcaceae bacterium]